jgi:hypothetical protein
MRMVYADTNCSAAQARRLRTKEPEVSLAWNECEAFQVCPQLFWLCIIRLIQPAYQSEIFIVESTPLQHHLSVIRDSEAA